uniref:Uncharacterized protein n=1 Tax=Salix viminalis TaxID=40686 RepID=A0A6N2LW34_SALVM
MLHQDPVVSDLIAAGLSGTIALSILRLFEETAKRRIFDPACAYKHRVSFHAVLANVQFWTPGSTSRSFYSWS